MMLIDKYAKERPSFGKMNSLFYPEYSDVMYSKAELHQPEGGWFHKVSGRIFASPASEFPKSNQPDF